jgi:hypothetical protein
VTATRYLGWLVSRPQGPWSKDPLLERRIKIVTGSLRLCLISTPGVNRARVLTALAKAFAGCAVRMHLQQEPSGLLL